MKYTRITLFLLLSVLVFSCNKRKDRTADLKAIDQKIATVQEAQKTFENTDILATKEASTTILDQIKFVQANCKDTLTKEEAFFLTSYKNVAKLVKNLGHTEKSIRLEIPHTLEQMTQLKKAITAGATQDKQGNEIDDEYLDGALKEEFLYADQLVNQINQLNKNCSIVLEKFPEMKPQADKIVSTLEQNMKKNG